MEKTLASKEHEAEPEKALAREDRKQGRDGDTKKRMKERIDKEKWTRERQHHREKNTVWNWRWKSL